MDKFFKDSLIRVLMKERNILTQFTDVQYRVMMYLACREATNKGYFLEGNI